MLSESTFSPTLENFVTSPDRNGIFPCNRWDRFPKRHPYKAGGGNIVFIDGHAEAFSWNYVYNQTPDPRDGRIEKSDPDIYWDPKRDVTNPPSN